MTQMYVLIITLKSGIQERLCNEDSELFYKAMKTWEEISFLLAIGKIPDRTHDLIFSYSDNFKVLLSEVVMMSVYQTEVEE